MTNDKTVTMSRELAQKVDDLMYIMTGHDSYPRLIHKYGKEWWTPVNEMRAEICTLLAAPVVERQEPVGEVADMKYNRVQFYRATGDTSKPYLLPGTKLYTSPPELAELQAIISRLTADVETMRAKNNELNDTVERLKGGQGEAVAWFTEDHLTDKSATTYDVGVSVMWAVKGWPVTPLYASQPAPVAADEARAFAKGFNTLETVDGKYKIVMQFAGHDDAWEAYTALSKMTACLDKVKELNQ